MTHGSIAAWGTTGALATAAAPTDVGAQTPPPGPFYPPPSAPPFSDPSAPPLPKAPATAGGESAGELFSQAFFLELGFSFMVGLAAGFALKVAFKIALVVIGLIVLGVFGLQYVGLVDVNWSGVESQYDTWAGWLGSQGGAFLDFMGRNLSNTVSFIAGLALGFRL
jgi:uncharacterized membrane protein (Fun14 family)